MEEGLYLCKVQGLKYCDYALLRCSDGFWWQYYKFGQMECCIGAGDLEIVEVVNKIQ